MNNKLKILHLEDFLPDAELVERELKNGNFLFEKLVVDNETDFVMALTAFEPDIILSDHSLPSFNSTEALAILKRQGLKIPFIIVTATMSEEFAVEVIKKGADDYILKDRMKRLPIAVESSLEKFRIENERQIFLDEVTRNEKRFRALIENMHDAIILIGPNGQLIYRSPYTEHITGYTDEDTKDKKVFELVHPEDLPEALALFQQAGAAQETPISGQFRMLHKNGHYIWIEGTITNLLHDESVRAFILNYRDVTKRKETEQQLEASEKFSKGILASLASHLAVVGQSGEIIAVNKAWDEFALSNGVTTLQRVSVGSNYFDVCKKALAEGDIIAGKTIEGIQSVLKKEKDFFELEYPCHSPEEERWFVLQVVKFGSDDTKVITTHQNITGRKKAEKSLRTSEASLQAIFENTSEGFVITDLKGGIKSFNSKAKEIYELNSGKELVAGNSIFDYVRESMKETYRSVIPKVFSGQDIQYDISFDRENGETKWFVFTITRVNNRGTVEGFSITAKDITERKAAEHTLKQSEARYRQIVETAQEGIWLIDENNQTTFANKKMGQILGYTPEEMLGKENFYFMDAAGKAEASAAIERRRKGIGETLELAYITKAGKHIWTSISANPIFDEEGKYKGALGMVSDITGQKNLKDLLDKANRLARIGNWEIDVINDSVYWSDITKEIREVAPDFEPDLYTGISYFKEGESKETISKRVKGCIENGTPWDEELQIITHKGNLKWIRSIGEGEFVNGRCIRVYGSFQDIDGRKKAELEILKIYEEKNTILESIGDGFFAVDTNWVVTYWNKESEKMLNKPKREMLGHKLSEVYTNSPFYVYLEKAVNENSVQHEEAYSSMMDRWYELSAFPSINGLSVYFKDITERKLSEIQLKKLNENLQQYAKDLAISNKELEQFAYIASHDLQEPLRMVTSFMAHLENKYGHVLDDKGKQYIHFAVDGAQRMRQIILDLLEFSRIGRIEDKQETVDLNDLAKEILILFGKQIQDKNATITIGMLPTLTIAISPIRQVLQNLVGNSLKYYKADTGQPLQIHISSKETSLHWLFAVADNGIGIKEEFFDKIFIIFQRLHSREEYQGTGMGLAISKKIVENMGGKIWVESTFGKGSTFHFTIAKNSR